jgi:hypothetical protein
VAAISTDSDVEYQILSVVVQMSLPMLLHLGTKLSRPFYQLLHRKITLFVEMGGAAYSGGYEEVIYRGYFFAATSCSRSFFLSSILFLRSFEEGDKDTVKS